MLNYITDFHSYVKSHPNQFSKSIKDLCSMLDKLLKEKWIFYKEADVIAFEKFCGWFKHEEGEWAGNKIELSFEQKWIIAATLGIKVYNEKLKKHVRFFRQLVIYVAKKWGKTTIIALLEGWMMFADKEPGAQVYNFAYNENQALILFNKVASFIKKNELLKKLIVSKREGHKKILVCEKYNAKMGYGSKAPKGKDGVNPNCVAIDEDHEITNLKLYGDNISAMALRSQPLLISISTAGTTRNSLHSSIYSKAKAILSTGKFTKNTRMLPVIFELDIDDKIEDEKCWIKANPGIYEDRPPVEYLREQLHLAKTGEENMETFISKHMNRSCDDAQTYYDTNKLKACTINITEDMIRDCYAYGGVDLAEFTDLCCDTTLIPFQHKDNPTVFDFVVIQKYYAAENRIDKKTDTDKVIYNNFLHTKSEFIECSELLHLCSGDIVDFKDVAKNYKHMSDTYEILYRKIGYDKWKSGQFLLSMNELGFTEEKRIHSADGSLTMRDEGVMTEVRQGKFLSDMIKLLKVLIEDGRLKFDKTNALLAMCCANAKVSPADKDNLIQVEKQKSNGRIDGLMSLLCALMAFTCDKENLIKNILPYSDCNKLK